MTSDSGAEIEYHGTNGQARLAVHRSVAARMRLFGAEQIATGVRQGTAHGGPSHRSASDVVVTSFARSDCYRLERQLPGGIPTR